MAGAGYRDWVAGDVPTAAQFDTFLQEQTVMVFASAAARDTALSVPKAEGMLTYLKDVNSFTLYTGAVWVTVWAQGALTAYTPAVQQAGAVTCTNAYSTWTRVGRLITGWFNLAVTGTGTASNVIIISAPVAAAALANGCSVGTGLITDVSATPDQTYKGLLQVHSTLTDFSIKTTSADAEDDRLGVGWFTAALAAGDIIRGQFSYEAAAD